MNARSITADVRISALILKGDSNVNVHVDMFLMEKTIVV